MRRLITIIITLGVLSGLSYGVAHFTHAKFIDYSFFIGMVITVMIAFFTSKGGGYWSRNVDAIAQATTGYKMDQEKSEFLPGVVFFTSLAYTVVSLVVLVIEYRSYF